MKQLPPIYLQVHLSNHFDLLSDFNLSLLKINESFGFYLSANKVAF